LISTLSVVLDTCIVGWHNDVNCYHAGYEWDVGHFIGAQRPDVDCFKSTEFGLAEEEVMYLSIASFCFEILQKIYTVVCMIFRANQSRFPHITTTKTESNKVLLCKAMLCLIFFP
jgi:hypothetical protein